MNTFAGVGVFVEVARQGSFVAAGRRLAISASAVGKSIARLEARLGVRLFHRSTRRLSLTGEGQRYLMRCQRMLEELEAAEQELQSAALPRGRLRIGLPSDDGQLTLALAGFLREYPDIELDLDYSDRLVDVIGEGFDAVIRSGEPRDSRLVARVLGQFRVVMVASPGYLAARGVPDSPAALAGHRCLHYRYPTSGLLARWPLSGAEGLSLPATVVCNTSRALIEMACQDQGIACLPEFHVRDAVRGGRLVILMEEYVDRSRTTRRVLWPASPTIPAKLRALIDFLAQHPLPDLPGEEP
ncbi:LysR family transcriptional regulator [Paludibacterium paludis]|uniref:LysR family transcriptional regulator n=1 Tax=Paludibacterium paludis TaxID=1225769 RepID=A0A918P1N3_9NEIS|nr:LysR family transcriptional regulator [Paludibacterium paludis]GGY12561.1 LysR family transcriptional regulator [Paludibacterium paludis]